MISLKNRSIPLTSDTFLLCSLPMKISSCAIVDSKQFIAHSSNIYLATLLGHCYELGEVCGHTKRNKTCFLPLRIFQASGVDGFVNI